MNQKHLKRQTLSVLAFSVTLFALLQGADAGMAQGLLQAGPEKPFISWRSPAKLRHILGSEKGDLMIGSDGIEFRATIRRTEKWAFQDIQTFRLSSHVLTIETYQNRKRHMPGIARFRFDLEEAVPPSIAAELAREVQRPSENGVPYPASDSVEIPTHHRTLTGGTNGILRFRDDGIDYVSSDAADSRSWRWADLDTVSNSDPWHLFVFGYRDTYAFDLKGRLSREMLNHISSEIWAHNDSDASGDPAAPAPGSSMKDGRRSDE
jgi:hypothetical protein